jgi:hypothetical protein
MVVCGFLAEPGLLFSEEFILFILFCTQNSPSSEAGAAAEAVVLTVPGVVVVVGAAVIATAGEDFLAALC